MTDLVCTGAMLKCSFGTVLATFSATPSATAATVSAGAPASAQVGVVTDTGPANVPPFGDCRSPNNPQVQAATQAAGAFTPQPCQPVLPAPWTAGSARVKVRGTPVLGSASRCSCGWGGTITVDRAGQTAVTLA